MKATSTFLAAIAAVIISSAALAAPEIHGINPADMDPSVQACQDFNLYGNGGWLKANPIPADQSYWGSFTILEEQNRESLHKVLERSPRRRTRLIPTTRRSATSTRRAWTKPPSRRRASRRSKRELAAIDKVATTAALQAEIARLQQMGVDAVFRLRLGPGPQRREPGQRRRLPGRPRPAGPRLLPEDRRRLEEAARPVRRARREDVRAHGRRPGEGRRRDQGRHGARDARWPRPR